MIKIFNNVPMWGVIFLQKHGQRKGVTVKRVPIRGRKNSFTVTIEANNNARNDMDGISLFIKLDYSEFGYDIDECKASILSKKNIPVNIEISKEIIAKIAGVLYGIFYYSTHSKNTSSL